MSDRGLNLLSNMQKIASLGKVLPSLLINIAVPVNFFHLERALGTFPLPKDPVDFSPAASVGFGCTETDALLDEEGWAVGLRSVDATPEEDSCPEATDAHGEAGIGLRADCWRRVSWLANISNGFYRNLKRCYIIWRKSGTKEARYPYLNFSSN